MGEENKETERRRRGKEEVERGVGDKSEIKEWRKDDKTGKRRSE